MRLPGICPCVTLSLTLPISSCETSELSREIILVPVLRAGLGMVDGITSLITTAKVGHIGHVRDHETLCADGVLCQSSRLIFPDAIVMVLDPMLATGGSASAAIGAVKKRGAVTIRLVCIVGAPEGVARDGEGASRRGYLPGCPRQPSE